MSTVRVNDEYSFSHLFSQTMLTVEQADSDPFKTTHDTKALVCSFEVIFTFAY